MIEINDFHDEFISEFVDKFVYNEDKNESDRYCKVNFNDNPRFDESTCANSNSSDDLNR